jgi:peptidoglycan/xylan/chitin deacetylase (PgdA/CDA1 family)
LTEVEPGRWPNGARSCVALAFDVDGPTGAEVIDDSIWSMPRRFNLGGYGPFRALPRILRTLQSFGLPATFFVPAWVVEQWPEQCRAIVDQGHEVAHHGYKHECFWDLTATEQDQVIGRSQAIFRDVLGMPATGFRAPTGDWGPDTKLLLLKHGIDYSSSKRDDDRPYLHVLDGKPSRLVEIPTRVDMDDYSCYAFSRDPDFPPGQDRIASYRLTLDNWKREFDGHHQVGGCFTTIFHPEVSGTPGRNMILEELLEHLVSQDEVWFARGREIADWWRARMSATNDVRHQ